MDDGIREALYDNASVFFRQLFVGSDGWVNHIIVSGIFDEKSPRTLWAAKRLSSLCRKNQSETSS